MKQPQAGRDRRAERHEATKREIVEAAWEVARDQGLGGWSLRELAQRVGMRGPSLYEYFDGKAAVYDAMYADGYRELLTRIDATPMDQDATSLAHAAAHVFFDFCVEDPARHQLLFLRTIPGFTPTPESYALAGTALHRLVDVLAAAGASSQESVDLWTAMMTGLASQQVSNDPGGHRWGRLVDDAVRMLLAR